MLRASIMLQPETSGDMHCRGKPPLGMPCGLILLGMYDFARVGLDL